MPAFTGEQLAEWSAGAWRPAAPSSLSGLTSDSRAVRPGQVFVALRGPRFDGHEFIAQAFRGGASAAVVDRDVSGAPGPLLRVDDTRKALGRLARGYRGTLSAEFLAVTGSVGKTTVKEMTADLISCLGPAARSRGNWNNDIGMPLSLLEMESADRFGVFELGMNHPGELAPLCAVLQPSWGIMTDIGPVHLEFFGSVEAIVEEKATVFRCLPRRGRAVASADSPWFPRFREAAPCEVITTSLGGDADYSAEVTGAGSGRFRVRERASGERIEFELGLPGAHVVRNALLAIAAARAHGVPWSLLQEKLRIYSPPPMRWNRVEIGRVIVINDAYNANPVSMAAALEAFAETPAAGKRWLVLGGMRELGAAEREEHARLGRLVAMGPWAGLVAVGALGRLIADAAGDAAGFAGEVVRVGGPREAADALAERLGPGDTMLLKASRAERLEDLLNPLAARLKAGGSGGGDRTGERH